MGVDNLIEFEKPSPHPSLSHMGARVSKQVVALEHAGANVYNITSCGDVAQLGERSVRNAEVVGSIPIVSTTRLALH